MNEPVQSQETQASIWSLLVTAVIVLSVVFAVRIYVAKPFIVDGVSMYPTFNTWDYLIIDEYSYNFRRNPERGEVVVLRYPANPKKHFIKRVIGLPGETVALEDTLVTITKTDGTTLELTEAYISPSKEKKESYTTLTLQEDEYYVMGDNRAESADSRYFGPVPRELIVGRAYMRLFPFTKIDYLPGVAAYTESD